MRDCHRCSDGRVELRELKTVSFHDQSSSAAGIFLRRSMSKVTYVSAGPESCQVLMSTEEEIKGAAAEGLCIIKMNATNIQARLATQDLADIVQSEES